MARREKHKAKVIDYEEDEQREEDKKAARGASDDDDEEANEDLTLKIVEKSLQLRAATAGSGSEIEIEKSDDSLKGNVDSGVVNVAHNVSGVGDLDTSNVKKVIKKKVRKKKKQEPLIENMDNGVQNQAVVEAGIGEKKEEVAASVQPTDPDSNAQISDNLVMRKLLRGPRYFDPPDSGGWETCFNCGEEGHMAVNCTALKRKKPCFVCGSLEHVGKQCHKAQDCFICKKGGHRAKSCPEKNKTEKLCLKCLGTGHDMLSCKYDYSPEDLKEIQCYTCQRFGHLSCVNFVDPTPREPSCYKCGQLGHTGLACGRLIMEDTGFAISSSCYKCGEGGHFARECRSSAKSKRSLRGDKAEKKAKKLRGETPDKASPSSCYVCGEEGHWARDCLTPSSCYVCGGEGHWARDCLSSAKPVERRNHKLSTPDHKSHKVKKDQSESKSAPHDLSKAHKRKKLKCEDAGFTTPQKPRRRGDWVMDDPGEFSYRNSRNHYGRSPSSQFRDHYSNFNGSNYVSSSGYSHHRYSASRFGNHYGDAYGTNHHTRW